MQTTSESMPATSVSDLTGIICIGPSRRKRKFNIKVKSDAKPRTSAYWQKKTQIGAAKRTCRRLWIYVKLMLAPSK
jgi:hypothetical protein